MSAGRRLEQEGRPAARSLFSVGAFCRRDFGPPEELRQKLASIGVSTLALAGGKSAQWLHHGAKSVAGAVPGGAFQVIPKQDHNLAARVMAKVLSEFFKA